MLLIANKCRKGKKRAEIIPKRLTMNKKCSHRYRMDLCCSTKMSEVKGNKVGEMKGFSQFSTLGPFLPLKRRR